MLTEQEYPEVKAICDRAESYRIKHATFSKSGQSALSSELAKHPDYAVCTNQMRGDVEQYEILRDMPDYIFAYVGGGNLNGMGIDRIMGQTFPITVWTGQVLGNATKGKSWSDRHGNKLSMFYARINGREYVGRGQGEGMCIRLKAINSKGN